MKPQLQLHSSSFVYALTSAGITVCCYLGIYLRNHAPSWLNYGVSFTIDVNRGRLLAAHVLETILNILKGYSDMVLNHSGSSDPASILSLPSLKAIKTAFGVLLNASMDYGAYTCHAYCRNLSLSFAMWCSSRSHCFTWVRRARHRTSAHFGDLSCRLMAKGVTDGQF